MNATARHAFPNNATARAANRAARRLTRYDTRRIRRQSDRASFAF